MRFSSTRKDFTFVFVNESPYPQHGVSVTDVPPQPLECSSAHSSKSGFSGLTRPWHRNCAKLLGALPGRVAFYTLPAFPGECLGPEYNRRNCRTPTCSCQCPRSHGGRLQPLQLRGKRNLRLSVNIRVANAYTRYSAILNFNFTPASTKKSPPANLSVAPADFSIPLFAFHVSPFLFLLYSLLSNSSSHKLKHRLSAYSPISSLIPSIFIIVT